MWAAQEGDICPQEGVTLQQEQTLKEPVAGGCLLTTLPTVWCKSFLEERLSDSSLHLPQPTPCITPIYFFMYIYRSSLPGFLWASLLRENSEDES